MAKNNITRLVVDCFYQERTYGGLIIGTPNEAINTAMIEHAKLVALKIYDNNHPILLEPERQHRDGMVFLPYYVTVCSFSVFNEEGLWAHPVVIFFHDNEEMNVKTLGAIVQERVDFSDQNFHCLL
jgi:hypothetical protein